MVASSRMVDVTLMWLGVWMLLPIISSFTPTQRRLAAFRSCTSTPYHCSSWQLHAKRSRYNSKQPLRFNSLDSSILTRLNRGDNATDVVVLVDANNVRGVDGFKLTTFDLLRSLASWSRSLGMQPGSVVCVLDHGTRPNAFTFDDMTLVFAGPNRTADDVIAGDCGWLVHDESKPDVLIATSDRELQSRCLRTTRLSQNKRFGPRASGGAVVEVFTSLGVANSLKRHWEDVMDAPATESTGHEEVLDALLNVESDVRNYHWPAVKNRRERRATLRTLPRRNKSLSPEEHEAQKSDEKGPDVPSNTPLGNRDFGEKTWHRVLIAEHLRQLLAKESSDKEIKADGVLQEALSRYRARQNSFAGLPVNLFYDQRIRHDFFSHQSLRRFLNESMASTELMEFVGTENDPCSEQDVIDAARQNVQSDDDAVSIMRKIVSEWGHESQFEIVTRFSSEAPANLQLRKSRDVRALLKRVAAKEKRAPDYTPRWYLLPEDVVVEDTKSL